VEAALTAPNWYAGRRLVVPVALALAALAAQAQAQSMNTNAASYNAGYGRVQGSENRPVNPSTLDANGNRLVVNGIIQVGSGSFASASAGASASASGVGSGGAATAIGNNLTVVTNGSYNTVIVTSTQTNNGDVTAVTNTGGGNGR
jgi:holdfast attachment protein HfaA